MKKSFFATVILCLVLEARSQNIQSWRNPTWAAGFMTAGANAASFRHFILLPDGSLESFAAGEQPAKFKAIDNVVAISAGTFHILALKKDGTVWSWGSNDDKQLGYEPLAKTMTRSDRPVQVSGIQNAIAISAVGTNSYALLNDGTIRAWGMGNLGMTGDGKKMSERNGSSNWSGRGTPVEVVGIKNAIAMSGPMALLSDGTVMSWGDGTSGRLGNGNDQSSASPVRVKGLTHVVAISYWNSGSLALLDNGTVWAWGENNKGQLGRKPIGDHDASNVPVQVQGISDAVAICAASVCVALTKGGTVLAWGWGAVGGMGQGRPGTGDVNPVPLKVPGVDGVVAINSGNGYALALKANGDIVGWGANMVASGIYHQTWKPVTIAHLEMPKEERR